MRYLAGYIGCATIFTLMMGLVFKVVVWPALQQCKKPIMEWAILAVLGFGMLRCMAVKPGGGDARPSPRRNPMQQESATTSTSANPSTTNTSLGETTLAISHIETGQTYVQLTAAWPLGHFNYDPVFDLFIAYPSLTNEWQWVASQPTPATATNCSFSVTPALLGLDRLPSGLFAKVTERNETCESMEDFDNDGVPNSYELYHGTNPYQNDASLINKLAVGADSPYQTLSAALQASEPYSIILLQTNELTTAHPVVLPEHPVLIEGPHGGYTVINSTTSLGTFMCKDGQDSRTLIRNVYLNLLRRSNFQVGFWCGGNLPWEGIGASPSFENVVVRTPRSETQYIAWLFYGNNGKPAKLRNCAVNALGAINVRGVETDNGPSISRYANDVQATMDKLSVQNGQEAKSLSFFDLFHFGKLNGVLK